RLAEAVVQIHRDPAPLVFLDGDQQRGQVPQLVPRGEQLAHGLVGLAAREPAWHAARPGGTDALRKRGIAGIHGTPRLLMPAASRKRPPPDLWPEHVGQRRRDATRRERRPQSSPNDRPTWHPPC